MRARPWLTLIPNPNMSHECHLQDDVGCDFSSHNGTSDDGTDDTESVLTKSDAGPGPGSDSDSDSSTQTAGTKKSDKIEDLVLPILTPTLLDSAELYFTRSGLDASQFTAPPHASFDGFLSCPSCACHMLQFTVTWYLYMIQWYNDTMVQDAWNDSIHACSFQCSFTWNFEMIHEQLFQGISLHLRVLGLVLLTMQCTFLRIRKISLGFRTAVTWYFLLVTVLSFPFSSNTAYMSNFLRW